MNVTRGETLRFSCRVQVCNRPGAQKPTIRFFSERAHTPPASFISKNEGMAELPYSKFKAYLRKLAARTVPSLHRAIRSLLHILKQRECAHYYKHAGYAAI